MSVASTPTVCVCMDMLIYLLNRCSIVAGTLVHSQENDNENTLANADITEEDLLLTSTVVYGFSLSDKLWCMFTSSPYHFTFAYLLPSGI